MSFLLSIILRIFFIPPRWHLKPALSVFDDGILQLAHTWSMNFCPTSASDIVPRYHPRPKWEKTSTKFAAVCSLFRALWCAAKLSQ